MNITRLVLPGIAMIAVSYGLARFSYGLMLPGISEDLGMTPAVAGLISSLVYLSYCGAIVFSIVWTSRHGPRGMILAAGISAVLGMLLMSIAPNAWVLALGVLAAGASTGFVSPPYGAAISLWIQEEKQGTANTWINTGTSLGLLVAGAGAVFLLGEWRMTYAGYAALALLILLWNRRVLPKRGVSRVQFDQGSFGIRGVPGAPRLLLSAGLLGMATAVFWTFAVDFLDSTGQFSSAGLSGFWIVLGIFGVLGGFSGSVIRRIGLPASYMGAASAIGLASLLLAAFPEEPLGAYTAAALFGAAYLFVTGVLIVWGIRVFIANASLGIGTPFLLLAVGQVAGSVLAGGLIGVLGYSAVFLLFGSFGLLAVMFGPQTDTVNPLPESAASHPAQEMS
ncbi:MFS transporter [Alkalicoccus chagannorensis]|uniref:MFS transporter n=1 Tax=Alkalicoccus chagannorensis TaxID=427072 RepID=UPI0003FF7333|nr:MFS transporter [Alkalicoccus chagannorensis]